MIPFSLFQYAELETCLTDIDRARAIYEYGISQQRYFSQAHTLYTRLHYTRLDYTIIFFLSFLAWTCLNYCGNPTSTLK